MPGFIKTPKDEARWEKAKEAAGKSTKAGSEGYWKLSNYIYHKMGKTEEDEKQADLAKQELFKTGFGGMLQMAEGVNSPKPTTIKTSVPSATKMPKQKKMADPFGKPSLFFKSEHFSKIKHPTVRKLRDFLEKKHKKSNLK